MNKKLGRLVDPTMGLYFLVLLIFAGASFLMNQPLLAALEAGTTALFLILYQLRRASRRKALAAYIQNATSNLENASRGDIPLPMALIRLVDEEVFWANQRFAKLTGMKESLFEQKLSKVLPGFSTDWLIAGNLECPHDLDIGDRRYRVYGTTFHEKATGGALLGSIYLIDLTELYQVRDEYIRSRPVVSIILLDNYDELTKNLPENAISTLNAELDQVITRCIGGYHGMLRRLERNRYLFVFEERDLQHCIENKFPLLEEIRQVESPTGVAATISMGIGQEGITFEESYNFAALSIEMALSRGGDQVVVKGRYNFSFYGGRNKETDHRSKVRSRVTANSLSELVAQCSQVFVMGHKNADLDALGAAVGICCLCRKKGKNAKIVIDLEHNAAGMLLEQLRAHPVYENCFISGQEALLQADPKSTLIVVDTNRPDQVECVPLLEAISKVCVVDHHRRAADYINPVVVELHEPYASSASELVTELLQYAVDSSEILPIEAKALLAGIMLDTKSFNVRTGERTFEAAAFLRRLGADTVDVKKLLQSDLQATMARYRIIQTAQMYRNKIAIAALNETTTRVIAAQAADELLGIQGILTSFVMYPQDDQVIISARSIGDANVQMILEPLGGGGNAATAGAQVKNCDVKTALERLTISIDKYYAQ